MEPKIIGIRDVQNSALELQGVSSGMRLAEVFAEKKEAYLNGFNLFIAHFNAKPNFIHEIAMVEKSQNGMKTSPSRTCGIPYDL